ncbi:MAG: ABC transporter ATP-binding protein [Clostridiales bacterium]|jgi:ABC-type lipoprotein export system ATPase subunit|nr:ABC transporter ATP-binding protein [Clostridiales bacterium]
MIKTENISKVFNARSENRNQVLKNVSLELPEKGLVAIFGKSGSGKTTLLNIMGGLDKQDGGSIYIDGENTKGRVDKIRNAKVGFIFQNYYLEKNYTITEILRNQMLIAGFSDEKEIKERTAAVLNLVEMERYKNKQADALSGGQQQRVAIARAIIKGSDVIFADEPTGNLDAQNTIKVMDILKEISKRQLVVLVTHELTLIKKYADSCIEIVDGEIRSDSQINGEVVYDTEQNNLHVDESGARELNDGGLDIRIYGNPTKGKDNIKIINDNGMLYICAGKNVTVLDDSSEKRIVFHSPQKSESPSDESAEVKKPPTFSKSTAKKNGRLFTLKSILRLQGSGKEERLYSTTNIFKQIFITAMAVGMCFFSFTAFGVLNTGVENKSIDVNSVYTDLNAYTDLRRMDELLYKDIDFFETQMREGDFSYNNLASLSGIKVNYSPKAIGAGAAFDGLFGEMPTAGEALISRALAEELKSKQRLKELQNDRSLLLMIFEHDFRVSGIVEGKNPVVYLNKGDYVNFLNVYGSITFTDRNGVFFSAEYISNTFTAEICEADGSMGLNNNQIAVEINRNSLYKMMPDVTLADSRVRDANDILSAAATSIYLTDSKPMYVRQFKITRSVMTTDIIIYVNSAVLNNIFVYIAPNLDALSLKSSAMGVKSEYYFEINTEGGEQLAALNDKLYERGISAVNIPAIYESENANVLKEAVQSLSIFLAAIVLMYLIYYFIEKSGSLKNSKGYGVYRAIGVNKSNLIFKEGVTACTNNLVGYLVCFFITAVLMCVRYALMNTAFGGFVGLAAGIFAVSALLMVGISVTPYLFVLYKTPAKILAKYDI